MQFLYMLCKHLYFIHLILKTFFVIHGIVLILLCSSVIEVGTKMYKNIKPVLNVLNENI